MQPLLNNLPDTCTCGVIVTICVDNEQLLKSRFDAITGINKTIVPIDKSGQPGTTIGLLYKKTMSMEPIPPKRIDSPAWQNPAPGNEQNDSVKRSSNETIKNGGNSRSAEDDLPLEKQPYRDDELREEDVKEDFNEDPDEQSFK